jgi:hypothetical protein
MSVACEELVNRIGCFRKDEATPGVPGVDTSR